MIAGGVLENTPENLRRWIADTQAVKLDSKMPVFAQSAGGKLSDDDIDKIAVYLESLR
jgi:cytochrome c oxidase subunit 2